MKKKLFKCILPILIFALVSFVCFLIARLFGIENAESLKSLILSTGRWSRFTFVLLESLSFILLCFVPLVNTSFVVVSLYIFGPYETIILCLFANFISSSILFFLGDKVGEKMIIKLIGKSNLTSIQEKLDTKSKLYLPILYIVPAVPDESLALIAGMTKMKYLYFISICMIYHLLELVLFCIFGGGFIDWTSLRFIDWIFVLNFVLIDFVLIKKLEKYFNERKK